MTKVAHSFEEGTLLRSAWDWHALDSRYGWWGWLLSSSGLALIFWLNTVTFLILSLLIPCSSVQSLNSSHVASRKLRWQSRSWKKAERFTLIMSLKLSIGGLSWEIGTLKSSRFWLEKFALWRLHSCLQLLSDSNWTVEQLTEIKFCYGFWKHAPGFGSANAILSCFRYLGRLAYWRMPKVPSCWWFSSLSDSTYFESYFYCTWSWLIWYWETSCYPCSSGSLECSFKTFN